MTQSTVEFWADVHTERASSDDAFEQMGKKGFSLQNFFVSLKDTVEPLDIKSSDILLDAGGGVGWISAAIAPFVSRIFLYDYVPKSIEKAHENINPFKNITAYVDDMTTHKETKTVLKKEFNKIDVIDKAIVLSSLQYLAGMDTVEQAFQSMFDVLNEGGRAVYALNPDIQKKKAHIESYHRLDWSKERIEHAIEMEEMRLWFDFDHVCTMAKNAGFQNCTKTHSDNSLWQSTHMFNFILEK